jgi:tRNA threonylcarbamoyladenosine biosynthesis protein TsaB
VRTPNQNRERKASDQSRYNPAMAGIDVSYDALLLALETSSRTGSVALQTPNGQIHTRRLSSERRSAADLLPTIRDLLEQIGARLRDVRIVAFSQGPGSFTGLRIGATVARMLHSVSAARVVAIPSLEVIACNALEGSVGVPAGNNDAPARLAAILDARRGRVYGAAFERDADRLRPLIETGLYDPTAFLGRIRPPFWILGQGVAVHRAACGGASASRRRINGVIAPQELWTPSAEWVARLGRRLAGEGRFCLREQIVPLYIRPPECEEVYEQRRAAARTRRGENQGLRIED